MMVELLGLGVCCPGAHSKVLVVGKHEAVKLGYGCAALSSLCCIVERRQPSHRHFAHSSVHERPQPEASTPAGQRRPKAKLGLRADCQRPRPHGQLQASPELLSHDGGQALQVDLCQGCSKRGPRGHCAHIRQRHLPAQRCVCCKLMLAMGSHRHRVRGCWACVRSCSGGAACTQHAFVVYTLTGRSRLGRVRPSLYSTMRQGTGQLSTAHASHRPPPKSPPQNGCQRGPLVLECCFPPTDLCQMVTAETGARADGPTMLHGAQGHPQGCQ